MVFATVAVRTSMSMEEENYRSRRNAGSVGHGRKRGIVRIMDGDCICFSRGCMRSVRVAWLWWSLVGIDGWSVLVRLAGL